MLYFQPFLVAFFLAALFSALLVWFFARWGWGVERTRDVANTCRFSKCSRLGGFALGGGFFLAIFTDPHLVLSGPLWGMLLAAAAAIWAGVLDDFRDLSWKSQLALQSLVALSAVSFGARITHITNPLGGVFLFDNPYGTVAAFLLSIVWIVAVMNAVNWLDGADGLSGGTVFIATTTLALLALKAEVNQPPMAIVAMAFAGAVGGFLLFNFHPARIFAGTGGSMLMGLVLATLSIIAGMKIATTLVVMALPILDFARVVYLRKKDKVHLAKADERHLHHRLAARGWSVWQICFFVWGTTAAVSFLALNTRALGKLLVFVAVALIWVAVSYFVRPVMRLCVKKEEKC